MKREYDFDEYVCRRGDDLDNAAHDLLCILAREEIEWDISLIREVIENAADVLANAGIVACDPWYEGDERIPCYQTELVAMFPCAAKCPFTKGDQK